MTPLLQLAPGLWLPRVPEGYVLFVFKCECEDVCDFWDSDSGANACLLISRADLAQHPVAPPTSVLNGETRILPQVWVDSWIPSDDGITPEQAEAVDDPSQYWDLPDEIQAPHGFESGRLTKAGGGPSWTGNGPDNDPPRPRRLIFQIDNWIAVDGPRAALVEHVAEFKDFVVVDKKNYLMAANFMSDGIAYIFDVTPDAPEPTPRLTIKR